MFGSNLSVDALWNILGWTMIHFFWIGAIATIIVTLARLALRYGPATIRYAITLIGFLALAASPIAIAAWLMMYIPVQSVESSIDAPTASGFAGELAAASDLADDITPLAAGLAGNAAATGDQSPLLVPRQNRELSSVGLSSTLILALARLEGLARYLPWLWLVGSPLTFVLLATGLVGAERLRRNCQSLHSGPIHDACLRLRQSLHIGRHVAVAVCDRVAVPVLVGIVRPLILLPSIAVGGWSPEQIEMVLVHELAHVRRWDNLVNLVQRIIESLLFFHPAVWLMSGWLRRDREECCDALVVRHTNQPREYAETLLAIAAQAAGPPLPLAGVALTGHARRLADRIRLILGQPNDPMLVSRRTLAVALFVLVCSVALPLSYFPPDTQAEETDAIAESDAADYSEAATNYSEAAETSDHAAASDTDQRLELESAGTLTVAEAADGELRIEVHEKPKQSSRFPSLEEQKLADLAWKRLRIELEPIHKEDLASIRALGFDGGIKVSRAEANWENGIWTDDVLVGLHVWPTTSLKDVADVLNRDDLTELNPLKFYVVRQVDLGSKGFGMKGDSDQVQDKVITGRIEISSSAARQNRLTPRGLPAGQHDASLEFYPAEGQRTGKVTLRSLPPPYSSAPAATDWIEIDQPAPPSEIFGAGSVKLDSEGRFILQLTQQREKVKQKFRQHRSALEKQLASLKQQRAEADEPVDQMRLDRAISETEKALQELAAAESKLEEAAQKDADAEHELLEGASTQREKDEAVRHVVPDGGRDAPGESPQRSRFDKLQLVYKGGTFQDWRDIWQNELSTLSRVDAVKALAAFGANGYGPEAAEAILDVAKQLDWRYIESSDSDAGRLKNVCIEAFVGGESTGGYRIPTKDWLPLFVEQIKQGDEPSKAFAPNVFGRLSQGNTVAIEPLLKLSREPELIWTAIAGLKAIDPRLENEAVLTRLSESFREANTREVKLGLIPILIYQAPSSGGGFVPRPILRYVPELMPLLFDHDPDVRRHARYAIQYVGEDDAPPIVGQLIDVINDENRKADHIDAIRALAAIGPYAKPADSVLSEIVKIQEGEAQVAAAFALMRVREQVNQAELRLITVLGGEPTGGRPKFADDRTRDVYDALVESLDKEEEQVFPSQQLYGGGFGGGGGGVF